MSERIVRPRPISRLVGSAGSRPKRSVALRRIESALWGVALAVAAYLGYVALDRQVQDMRRASELRELSRATPDLPGNGTTLQAGSAPEPSARRKLAGHGELLGRLEIPGVGISAFVAAGTEVLTLRRGVGHIDGTALPGEQGNIGLAGHRDTVFRGLRKLRIADHILLVTPAGSFEYAVESLHMVAPEQVDVLADTALPTLTLVTCYPFDFIGPAPLRFIVRAREITRSPAAASDTN